MNFSILQTFPLIARLDPVMKWLEDSCDKLQQITINFGDQQQIDTIYSIYFYMSTPTITVKHKVSRKNYPAKSIHLRQSPSVQSNNGTKHIIIIRFLPSTCTRLSQWTLVLALFTSHHWLLSSQLTITTGYCYLLNN